MHVLNDRFYHGYDKYNVETTIMRHIGTRITREDAQLIRTYIAEKQTIDHIGEARSRKIAVHLTGMRRFITTPYKDMTDEDVILGFAELKKGHSEKFTNKGQVYDGGQLKPNTQRDYIKITLGFINWLNDTQRPKEKWINVRRMKNAQKIEGAGQTPYKPEDIITEEEILAMEQKARTVKQKLAIRMKFETVARIGELGRAVWADLKFPVTPDGSVPYIEMQLWDTKAKKFRYPTLVDCKDLLILHRNNYPAVPEGNSFIFVKDDGEPYEWRGFVKIFSRAAKSVIKEAQKNIDEAIKNGMSEREAIEKYPLIKLKYKPFWKTHNYRHSGLTKMCDDGWNELDIKEIGWANPNTPEMKTYINRSREQIRDHVLEYKGIKKEEEKENPNKVQICRYCRTRNPPLTGTSGRYCGKCGRPLAKAIVDLQQKMNDDCDNDPRYKAIEARMNKVYEEELEKVRKEFATIIQK